MRRGGFRSLKASESEIERAFGDYLHYLSRSIDLCFYKQNVRGFLKGNVYTDQLGNKVVMGRFQKDQNPYARTGLPDYVVIYRGFHGGFELKKEGGVQSPNQIEFQSYLTQKGKAPYYLIDNIDEGIKAIHYFITHVDTLFLMNLKNN